MLGGYFPGEAQLFVWIGLAWLAGPGAVAPRGLFMAWLRLRLGLAWLR